MEIDMKQTELLIYMIYFHGSCDIRWAARRKFTGRFKFFEETVIKM